MITPPEISAYFRDRIPASWFSGQMVVESDADEILCVGTLPPSSSVDAFREETREQRVTIAVEAEARFGRKVSWGVEVDGARTLFTNLSTPVMTRLRLPERAVLDTLIDGGVARSRSEALAWCVKLVGQHQGEWLAELREALADVAHVRSEGPTLI
jgi:hypothetical protein